MTYFSKEFEIKFNLHIEVTHYRPARPAPACSNPSDPAYSDPGDDVEFEFTIYLLTKEGAKKQHPEEHEKKELPEELNFLYDIIYDEALEDYENKHYLTTPFDEE